MKKDIILAGASLVAIMVSACSKPSVEIKAEQQPPPVDEVQQERSTVAGKWTSGCMAVEGAPGIYAIAELTFETEQPTGGPETAGKLTVTGQGFSNATCSASLGPAETKVGTYHISGKSVVPGAFEVQTTLPDGVGGWETLYDIMMRQNGMLYFSKEGTLKADQRPKSINFNQPYKRI